MQLSGLLKAKIKSIGFVKRHFRTTHSADLLAFPRQVEIETTSCCNARCRHCEHPSLGRHHAHMEMSLFKKIIDECRDHRAYCREVFLFWMGEPLLDPSFFEKVKYAKKTNSFKVSSYSNGSLLTPDNCLKIIESGLDQIVFGTDGATKDSYESVRIGLSHDRMVEGISRLADLKRKLGIEQPRIHVQMVLTPHNGDETSLFESTWAGVADESSVRQMVVWGGDAIDEELMGYSRGLVRTRYADSTPCLFPWYQMTVAQDGRVALCCTDSRIREQVGDLTKQTIAEVWAGDRLGQLREMLLHGRIKEIPLCRTCNHRQILEHPWWWYS